MDATSPLLLDNLHFEEFVKYFNLDFYFALLTNCSKCPHSLGNIIIILMKSCDCSEISTIAWTTLRGLKLSLVFWTITRLHQNDDNVAQAHRRLSNKRGRVAHACMVLILWYGIWNLTQKHNVNTSNCNAWYWFYSMGFGIFVTKTQCQYQQLQRMVLMLWYGIWNLSQKHNVNTSNCSAWYWFW